MRKFSKQVFFFFLYIGIAFVSNAQDSVGNTVNLRKCVDIALRNNLAIQQSETQYETSKLAYRQSIDNILPYINAQGNQGINFGRSINPYTNQYIDEQINTGNYGVNGSLVLFSGLQLQHGIRQNQYAREAGKLDYQQQKDNITLNVILAYLQVLSSQDILQISRQQALVDSQQVARNEILNQDGSIAPATLYDLRGQYANDLVNIVNNTNAVESAKVSLFQLMNVPYKRTVDLERVPMDMAVTDYLPNADSIYNTALYSLPMIKSADLRVKAYQQAVQAARGQYYPTLSFYTSISTNYSSAATANVLTGDSTIVTSQSQYIVTPSGNVFLNSVQKNVVDRKISFGDQFKNNKYTQLGLQLNIPILNFLRARNNVKQAKINLSNYQHVATATRNQLQQSVELAYQNMIAADGLYKSYKAQVDAYQLSFNAAEVKFNAGAITSVDYVITKNNLDRATINLTLARYNYVLRSKILDYYQGRLSLN